MNGGGRDGKYVGAGDMTEHGSPISQVRKHLKGTGEWALYHGKVKGGQGR